MFTVRPHSWDVAHTPITDIISIIIASLSA